MPLRPRIWLAALAALALVPWAPAGAQDPQLDPDSPAGTEYQLPTDRARQEASGRGSGGGGASGGAASAAGGRASGSSAGAAARPPLFGEGVDEEKSRPVGTGGAESNTGGTSGVEQDRRKSASATVGAEAAVPDGGGSGPIAVAGGAAGVLLLGALAGLALRRRSTRRAL